MLFCKEPVININIASVQQQSNSVDCGVFAIAFATSVAFGENPTTCQYDKSKMRGHLIQCLEEGQMQPFPQYLPQKRIHRCKQARLVLSVYCSCRSICRYDSSDPMVECSRCFEWYHKKCEKIPKNIFQNKHVEYFCKACK